MSIVTNFNAMSPWARVMLFVTLGKAFVAGAGLGLAALGVVDLASSLGVRPLVDLIERENVINIFALGGGAVSVVGQIGSMIWKVITR